ncbi:MAG: YeeE/YedE thiosulfate transporter family protein [Hyphomicrobium sp.]|jgi:hypothetical protein
MAVSEFTPLSSLSGGALIGASAVLLLLFSGRIAGVSGLLRGLLPPYTGDAFGVSLAFLAGLVAAPVVWLWITGVPVHLESPTSSWTTLAGGLLVGIGAALSRGCTSGHGVCGLSRLSPRSLVAVPVFMATAAITVFILRHLIGGGPWG